MTTQALEAARDLLTDIFTGKQTGRDKYAMETKLNCVHALAVLTEAFDPEKHLTGWLKEGTGWIREVGGSRFRVRYDEGWVISESAGNGIGYPQQIFTGHIPTRAFWEALCGALNIKG